jgi:hypothetical protein
MKDQAGPDPHTAAANPKPVKALSSETFLPQEFLRSQPVVSLAQPAALRHGNGPGMRLCGIPSAELLIEDEPHAQPMSG